jgi:environmental stress-induced protein Ves
MRQYTKSDFKVMPWKNGQGITTEIFRIEDVNRPDEFLFRLSRAEVNCSGGFSIFPFVNRQLMLLKGNGFILTSKDFKKTIDKPWDFFSFKGEDAIECELLDGPCEDFNIMVKRDWKDLTTTLLKPEKDIEFIAENMTFLYDVSREVLWELRNKESLVLNPGNFVVIQLID